MKALVPPRATPVELLARAEALHDGFLADLAELVAIDSGSYSPAGVDLVGAWVARRLDSMGFDVELVPLTSGVGDVLVARRAGRVPVADRGRRILLAAHMDTVFDDGTAAARPFSRDGVRAHGPGVSDDKGGLLAGLTALQVLGAAGMDECAEIIFLATPDEEIGSPASRPVTEAVARTADLALALECARENGDLVIARKGVADLLLTVTGRAAHAGIEPERGANAALAAAHLLIALQELGGRDDGVTVNVGTVRAGTRSNIVCPRAELRMEVRSPTTAGMSATMAAIDALAARPVVAGTRVEVRRLELCPPMEDGPPSRVLFAHAAGAAAPLGLSFDAVATGGVGDANIISGAGTPTLDGLGPVGGADHTPEEWLDVSTVAPRVALLASLIAVLGTAATG